MGGKFQPAAAVQRLTRQLGELREIGNLQAGLAVDRRAVPSYRRAGGENEAFRCRSELLDVDDFGGGIGRARKLPFQEDAKSRRKGTGGACQILDAAFAGDRPARLRPVDIAISDDVKLGVATVDAVAIGTQLRQLERELDLRPPDGTGGSQPKFARAGERRSRQHRKRRHVGGGERRLGGKRRVAAVIATRRR